MFLLFDSINVVLKLLLRLPLSLFQTSPLLDLVLCQGNKGKF